MQQGSYIEGFGSDVEVDLAVKSCEDADVCVVFLGLSQIEPHASQQVGFVVLGADAVQHAQLALHCEDALLLQSQYWQHWPYQAGGIHSKAFHLADVKSDWLTRQKQASCSSSLNFVINF